MALTAWSGPNGAVLAARDVAGTIWHWDPATAAPTYVIPQTDDTEGLEALTAWTSLNGRMLVACGGSDGTIRRWDVDGATPVGEPLTGHAGEVEVLAAWTSPDGPVLASGGSDGTIRRWDANAGTPIGEPMTGHAGGVQALAPWTGADGSVLLASGGRDGVIRVWNTATGELLNRVLVEPIRLRGLADRPSTRDLLSRTALTQALANLLLWHPAAAGGETGPSMVAFEGPWGTGKTTIMRLVETRITAKPEAPSSHRYLSVAAARKILRQPLEPDEVTTSVMPTEYRGALTAWFNPWICQSSEQVWAGLARSIYDAAEPVLYPAGSPAEAQGYWLRRNAHRIDRYAIGRKLILRILSPLLGFSAVIALATVLVSLADLSKSTLFHFAHLRATPGNLAVGAAVIFLLSGIVHTIIRYGCSSFRGT
jgi:WD40 repeat protein